MIENGYITIAIPLLIFGYALTEETRPSFTFWKSLFLFITATTLIKFSIHLLADAHIIEVSVRRNRGHKFLEKILIKKMLKIEKIFLHHYDPSYLNYSSYPNFLPTL